VTIDRDKLEEIRDLIIQPMAENMDLYGISDSIGRLYGTLYFSNQPLSLDELREKLGMSKTSMSTGVRTLLESNMVNKVWRKGVRKDLYQAQTDWYKIFFDYFSTKWDRDIENNLDTLKVAKREYQELMNRPDTSYEVQEEILNDLKKLEKSEEYYHWLERLINTFESEEIFTFVKRKMEEK